MAGKPRDAFDAQVDTVLLAARRAHVEAEVYLIDSRSTRVRVQDGEVETFTLADSRGMGVRVLHAGRIGYAYTESLATAALEQAVSEAASNAAILPVDPAAGLGVFQGEPPTLDLHNPDLLGVPVDRKIQFALDIDREAHEADSRVKTVTGSSYFDSETFRRVASTSGVDRQFLTSSAGGAVMPLLSEGEQNKNHAIYRWARCFEDLNPQWMAQEAIRRSAEKLGAREIESGAYTVVLDPETFADLLETFCGVFSAKVAQEGKSLLRGKVGEAVASKLVNLLDDPLLDRGAATRPFDDEGCPSKPMVLVAAGVFSGFLHNVETARRENTVTTGHASRGGYGGILRVSPSNLVFKGGTTPKADLLTRGGRTLYITEVMGLHAGANAISGDFSLQAEGFLYEGGERVPVHLFTVSGNFFKLLEGVAAVGNDVVVQPSGTTAPSVLVDGLAIAGR